MDFGVTGKSGAYYPKEQYRRTATADIGGSVNFAELASVKAAQNVTEQTSTAGMSFKDMWQTRFPGAYYRTMDASNIPQGVWQRNDFPFEKFFQNNVDESVLNWKPNGANPAMDSSGVQSRIDATLGKKAIVVPLALEEKMKNDPALAQRIMTKIENYIVTDEAMTPDRICSYLIVLDENGEIARSRASSGGGNITGPTEAEIHQFEAEQAAKRKRREEYARLNEESALKRRMLAQEAYERHYQSGMTKKAALGTYQSSFITVDTNIFKGQTEQ